MKKILKFFRMGEEKPLIQDKNIVDRLFKRYRLSSMLTVSIGYGVLIPCVWL